MAQLGVGTDAAVSVALQRAHHIAVHMRCGRTRATRPSSTSMPARCPTMSTLSSRPLQFRGGRASWPRCGLATWSVEAARADRAPRPYLPADVWALAPRSARGLVAAVEHVGD